MPDWQGTTGRDDLVGGDNRVRVHLDGPCTHQDRHVCPECAGLTKAEVAALRDYFALHPDGHRVVEPRTTDHPQRGDQ